MYSILYWFMRRAASNAQDLYLRYLFELTYPYLKIKLNLVLQNECQFPLVASRSLSLSFYFPYIQLTSLLSQLLSKKRSHFELYFHKATHTFRSVYCAKRRANQSNTHISTEPPQLRFRVGRRRKNTTSELFSAAVRVSSASRVCRKITFT